MNMTCCPMYTIKCNTLDFELSKSHKKVIKRVNRYLITGDKGDSEMKEDTGAKICENSVEGGDGGDIERRLAEKGDSHNIQVPSGSKVCSPIYHLLNFNLHGVY